MVSSGAGLGFAIANDFAGHGRLAWTTPASWVLVAVAVLLVDRLPQHRVTWVVVVMAVATTNPATVIGESLIEGSAPRRALEALGNLGWIGTVPMVPALLLLFPDGELPSPRWRRLAVAYSGALIGLVVLTLGLWLLPDLELAWGGLGAACALVVLGTGFASVAAVVRRRARATPDERGPYGMFVAVAVLIASMYALGLVLAAFGTKLDSGVRGDVITTGLFTGLPAALGYAVLAKGLYDIELRAGRAVAWGAATGVVAAAYLVVIGLVARAVGGDRQDVNASLVAALGAGIFLLPLRDRVQRRMDRLVFGDRGDPLAVVRALGAGLADTSVEDVPQRIARMVVEVLRVPWSAVDVVDGGAVVREAAVGVEPSPARELARVPLRYAGSDIGVLLASPRSGQARLGAADVRLLDDIAAQCGAALHAGRTMRELVTSRDHLVAVRDQERNRLRRELHDDLSPALAGIALALGTARRLAATVDGEADRLLAGASTAAQQASQRVQRLLADLRPLSLHDDVVALLHEHAGRLTRPGEMLVTVDVNGDAAALPDAVEVAVYRIAIEAMTNAARHSGGTRCTVLLTVGPTLRLLVEDDGRGLDHPSEAHDGNGIGLRSMGERAAEVGGHCEVLPRAGGGTAVLAEIPIVVGTST